MDNTTKPRQGVAQMAEVAGSTGQVGGQSGVSSAGLYRHPQSGQEIVTFAHPLFGDTQSRAAERTGFVYVGPAPEGYVKALGTPSLDYEKQPERANEVQADELKGLRARLNQLEAAEDARKNGNNNATPGAEATKQAAADKTAEQTNVEVDPATGDAKPELTEANGPTYKELQAEAKELGVSSKGSTEELTQRIAEAKAEKENK